MLSKIGSSLGKPLYADECTTQTSRISFARISNVIKIQDPKGRVVEQQVEAIFLREMLTSGTLL